MNKCKKKLSLLPLFISSTFGLTACENDQYAAISCTPKSQSDGQLNCASADGDIAGISPGDKPGQSQYDYKGGVTGRVMSDRYWVGATVCLDINRNGECDSASEPLEKTYADGQFSFVPEATLIGLKNNAPLLATTTVQPDGPTALYAPTPDSATTDNNITTYTTLVASEMAFNPVTYNSENQSRSSLADGRLPFGTDALLQGQDYILNPDPAYTASIVEISNSLKSAQALNNNKKYRATAAAVDAMYQASNYAVSITPQDIELLNPIGDLYSTSFSPSAISWKTAHEDEISVDLDIAQSIGVVGSQYHNRLIVFNLDADEPERLSKNLFASSDVERDEIDALTGASEQTLTEIKITPDSLGIIVAVEKYKSESNGKGVGIYKADLSNPSKIPFTLFAEHEESNENFYAFPNLTSITLSADGTTVALGGSDNKAAILSASDFTLIRTIDFDSTVLSVALDTTGSTLYASLEGERTGIVVTDVIDGTELGFLDTGTSTAESLRLFSSDARIAWNTHDSALLSIGDSADPSNLSKISVVEATETIKSFDFSPNSNLLILGLKSGNVELHSLTPAPQLINTYQSELDAKGSNKPINAVAFESNDRALVSIRNGIQLMTINTDEFGDFSDDEKQAWLDSHR